MKKAIAILLLLCLMLCGCDSGEGYTECWGEYGLTEHGEHILIQEDRTIYMTDGSEEGNLFDDLSSGDKIKIHVVLIEEIEGRFTANVLRCEKIPDYSKLGGK